MENVLSYELGYHGDGVLSYSPSSAMTPTNCWSPLEVLTDGGYGYDSAQAAPGNMNPSVTSDGQVIYSYRFYSTGEWYLELGVAGDEQSPNSVEGVMQFGIHNTENVLMVWNETNLRYEGDDLGTATAVIAELGNEVCFTASIVPELLLWINFETLETT